MRRGPDERGVSSLLAIPPAGLAQLDDALRDGAARALPAAGTLADAKAAVGLLGPAAAG